MWRTNENGAWRDQTCVCGGIFVEDLGWEKFHFGRRGAEFQGTASSLCRVQGLAPEKVRLGEWGDQWDAGCRHYKMRIDAGITRLSFSFEMRKTYFLWSGQANPLVTNYLDLLKPFERSHSSVCVACHVGECFRLPCDFSIDHGAGRAFWAASLALSNWTPRSLGKDWIWLYLKSVFLYPWISLFISLWWWVGESKVKQAKCIFTGQGMHLLEECEARTPTWAFLVRARVVGLKRMFPGFHSWQKLAMTLGPSDTQVWWTPHACFPWDLPGNSKELVYMGVGEWVQRKA